MRRCRKMTKADVLRDATRRKGAPLTKMEARALLVEHSRAPRLVCQTRRPGLLGLGFLGL